MQQGREQRQVKEAAWSSVGSRLCMARTAIRKRGEGGVTTGKLNKSRRGKETGR